MNAIATNTGNAPIPVFIDTDAGWDDWCAILFIALSATVKLVGVSVNGCGEAYYTPAFRNARNLLSLIGREDIPVVRGERVPISYSNVFPSDFRDNISAVYGYKLPNSKAPEDSRDPNSALFNALERYPDLVYLAIGGFTNFARYLRESAYLGAQPMRIIAMGGAFNDEPGNVKELFGQAYPNNLTAEWNMFIDPAAAQFVMEKSRGVLNLVSLNASRKVPLTQSVVDMFEGKTSGAARFVHAILAKKLAEAAAGGYSEYFYDPLAAAVISDPDLATRVPGGFKVVTDYDQESNNLGKTLFFPDSDSGWGFYQNPDPDRFYRVFSDAIIGNSKQGGAS